MSQFNPEFKRHLWLELSAHRLFAMPLVLALTFIGVFLSNSDDPAKAIFHFASALFCLLVLLWGSRNIGADLIDEWRNQTWDQQRMSALSPWTLMWGKLFGSTIYQWYGGAFCLLLMLLAGLNLSINASLLLMASLCALAILFHASYFALTLYLFCQEKRSIQRGGFAPMAFLALAAVPILPKIFESSTQDVYWYGQVIAYKYFVLGSLIWFAGWALLAAWRVMSQAMQEPSLPWAWLGFTISLALYLTGFQDSAWSQQVAVSMFLVALAMSYASLISEKIERTQWRAIFLRQQRGQWLKLGQRLPLWPVSFALTLLLLLPVSLTTSTEALDSTWQSIHGMPWLASKALIMVLMFIRDAAFLHFLVFSAKPKRAFTTFLLYLSLINGLLPFLAELAKLEILISLFAPFRAKSNLLGLGLMLTHTTLAVFLLRQRWKSSVS